MVEWSSRFAAPTNRNRKSWSHEGKMARLRTLPWCIMHALVQVVPRNEAFTHAMPRCHHGYCMSSAGNAGGADEAGHEPTLTPIISRVALHLWRAYQEDTRTDHSTMILIPKTMMNWMIDGALACNATSTGSESGRQTDAPEATASCLAVQELRGRGSQSSPSNQQVTKSCPLAQQTFDRSPHEMERVTGIEANQLIFTTKEQQICKNYKFFSQGDGKSRWAGLMLKKED